MDLSPLVASSRDQRSRLYMMLRDQRSRLYGIVPWTTPKSRRSDQERRGQYAHPGTDEEDAGWVVACSHVADDLGATAGLSSSAGHKLREDTAGQASSGTQVSED